VNHRSPGALNDISAGHRPTHRHPHTPAVVQIPIRCCGPSGYSADPCTRSGHALGIVVVVVRGRHRRAMAAVIGTAAAGGTAYFRSSWASSPREVTPALAKWFRQWNATVRGETQHLEEFVDALGPQRASAIEVVTMDGSTAYESVVKDRLPKAKIALDPFNVMQWVNQALDAIYRPEPSRPIQQLPGRPPLGGTGGLPAPRGSRSATQRGPPRARVRLACLAFDGPHWRPRNRDRSRPERGAGPR
jgi:Transposase